MVVKTVSGRKRRISCSSSTRFDRTDHQQWYYLIYGTERQNRSRTTFQPVAITVMISNEASATATVRVSLYKYIYIYMSYGLSVSRYNPACDMRRVISFRFGPTHFPAHFRYNKIESWREGKSQLLKKFWQFSGFRWKCSIVLDIYCK